MMHSLLAIPTIFPDFNIFNKRSKEVNPLAAKIITSVFLKLYYKIW